MNMQGALDPSNCTRPPAFTLSRCHSPIRLVRAHFGPMQVSGYGPNLDDEVSRTIRIMALGLGSM